MSKIEKRWFVISLFFFFQAEDGIRDLTVTGVQTCALPISRRGGVPPAAAGEGLRRAPARGGGAGARARGAGPSRHAARTSGHARPRSEGRSGPAAQVRRCGDRKSVV